MRVVFPMAILREIRLTSPLIGMASVSLQSRRAGAWTRWGAPNLVVICLQIPSTGFCSSKQTSAKIVRPNRSGRVLPDLSVHLAESNIFNRVLGLPRSPIEER